MQDAVPVQEHARPIQPDPTWKWSDRLRKWIAPDCSPFSGLPPPAATRFRKGDPSNIERGSVGGIISAQARAALAKQPDRVEKIVNRWLRDCERGDNRAREQLLDRLEGKVAQEIKAELTSRYVIEEFGVDTVEIEAEAPARAPDTDATHGAT